MVAQAHPKPTVTPSPRRPELRVVEGGRRAGELHLFTYVVVSAVAWTLWAALTVTAAPWYWWPLVPLAGWALVLAAHLRHVNRG
jgi:hypothetical protein